MRNLIIFGIFFMFCIKINLCEDATARALEITPQWRPMSLQMNSGPASHLISVSNLEATNKQHLAQIAQHNAQILRHIKGFHQPVTQYHNPFAMFGGQSASQQQQQQQQHQQQRNKENGIQQQQQHQQQYQQQHITHHNNANNGFISGKPSFLGKQELNPLKYNNPQQQHSSTMKIPGLIKHNSHYYANDFNNLSQQQQQHQQLLTTKSPLGRDATLAPSQGSITKPSASVPHPVMNKLHTHLALASRHQQQQQHQQQSQQQPQQQPQPITSQSSRFESFAIPSHVLSSYSQFGPASHIIRDSKPKISSSFINYPIEIQSSKHGNTYPQNYVSASQFVNANHPALAGHNYNAQSQSQQHQQQHQSSFSSLSSSNQNQLQNHNQILNYQQQNILNDNLLSTTIAPTNFPNLPPSVLTPFFQNVQQQQQKFETNNYDQLADNENNNHFNTISDEFTKHLVPPPPYKHTDSTKFREKPPLTTITTINDENKNVLINKINLQLGKSPLQDANRYIYNTGPMFLPTILPDNDSDNILSVPPPPAKTSKVNKHQLQQQQIQQQQHSLYNSETFFTTEKPNVFKNLNWASNSDFKQHKFMHPSYTGVNRPVITEQSTYAPMLPTPNDVDHEDVNSGMTHSFFTIEDAITAAPNFGDFYKDIRINHKPVDSDILKIKYKDAMRHEDSFHYESAPSLAPTYGAAPSDYPPPLPDIPSASPSPSQSTPQTPSPSSPPVFKYEPITTSASFLESSPEPPSPSLRSRGKPKNRRRRPKPQQVNGSTVEVNNGNDYQQSQRQRPDRHEYEQKPDLHDQNQEHDREPVRNSNDFRNNLRNRQRLQPQTSSNPTVVITEKPHRNVNRKPDIYKYSSSDESGASLSTSASASASDEDDFEKNIKVNINDNLFLNNYKTLNNENRKRPVTTSNSITTTQEVHKFFPTIQTISNDKVVTELEHELSGTTITNNQPFITRHRFGYTTTVQPSNEQFDDITSVLPEDPITEQQPATVIITNENEFFTVKPTQTIETDTDTTQTDDSAKTTLAYEHVRHRQKLRYKEKNEGQHTIIITTTTETPIEKQTDVVEVTPDSNKVVRLRPVNKYNANNRPRFSVKEYRQRLSTSTTTESSLNHESTTSGYTRLRFPTRNRLVNDIRNKNNEEKKFDKPIPTAEESIEEVTKPEIIEASSESAPVHSYPKRIPQKQLHRGQLSRITNEVSTTTTVKPTTRRGGNWREFSSKNRTTTSTITPIQSRTTEINENVNSRLGTTRNSTFVNRRPQNISLRQRIQNYYRKRNDTESTEQDHQQQQQQSSEQSYESDKIDLIKSIPSDDYVTEEYRRETAIMKIAKDDHSYRPYAHTTTEPTIIDHNDLTGSPSEQSQRVAELTLSGNMGSTPFKSVYMSGGPSRRIPGYFTLATEDPILPIEAFFPQVKKEKR